MKDKTYKSKKDIGILIAVIVAAGLIAIGLAPVVSSGIMSGQYRKFISQYTSSMSAARKAGIVTAIIDFEEQTVEADKAGQIYNLIVSAGMGKPQDEVPVEPSIEIRFPDSSAVQFWESTITEKVAKQKKDLMIRYQSEDGYCYQLTNDTIHIRQIK